MEEKIRKRYTKHYGIQLIFYDLKWMQMNTKVIY